MALEGPLPPLRVAQVVEFVVCNTDAQAMEQSLAPTKVQLGVKVTAGLGAGAKPDVGRAAAIDSTNEMLELLMDSHMCFITAGLGGGTGTGAVRPPSARSCTM